MDISYVKALVWVLPNPDIFAERNIHDHSACLSTKQLNAFQAEVSTKNNDGQAKSWTVDKCITDDTIDKNLPEEERKKIVMLVLQGHNAGCLFFRIGGDHYAYTKRMDEKKAILEELARQIKPDFSIEYIYFCITDKDCYDMREEKSRSNKSVLEKGIDNWMKKTNNIMDIWEDMYKGTKLPHLIKIRLTDPLTNRSGCLYLFDLLQPTFLPPTPSTHLYPNIYNSFEKIRTLLDSVVSTERKYDISINHNDNVWASLLMPFISGFGKLVIYCFLTECPKACKYETMLALDFIQKMRQIKATSLCNSPVKNIQAREKIVKDESEYKKFEGIIENSNKVIEETKNQNDILSKVIEELEYRNNNLMSELDAKNSYIDELEYRIQNNPLNEQNMKLQKKLHLSNQKALALVNLFKKAGEDATNTINHIKSLSYHRITSLKRQKTEDTKLIEKLQEENSNLIIKNRLVEDELAREFAINLQEKNNIRFHLKVLKESIDEKIKQQ